MPTASSTRASAPGTSTTPPGSGCARSPNRAPTQLKDERIYLGGFEIYRENGPDGTVTLERETLHVLDDMHRLALVETRTAGTDRGSGELIRYRLANHLDSSMLELDQDAQVICYEEYYPYGSTSYQAVRAATEAPKRYRYSGKERDTETGLSYYGARYYVPWLGRWSSVDPLISTAPMPGTAEKPPPREFHHATLSVKPGSITKLGHEESALTSSQRRPPALSTSPYAFTGNNPIGRTDADGRNWDDFTKTLSEGWVSLKHPIAAWHTKGIVSDETATIDPALTTRAIRFSTRIGLTENVEHEGSQVNAFRHVLWQAMLTRRYGSEIAKQFADAHEVNPAAIKNQDPAAKEFDTLNEADQSIDLRNNIIGRAIGEENKNVIGDDKQLAEALLLRFHEGGLWVAVLQPNGKYKAVLQKLTDAEFEASSAKLNQLSGLGLKPAQAAQRQEAIDNSWKSQAIRAWVNLDHSVRQVYGAP